ncbi:MAG TPA: ATP synthase subunit I [Candidatus Acidoferrales bacterium]|nr:ATP synthase subunit I [Candidatus Acidoferrales bacterium]
MNCVSNFSPDSDARHLAIESRIERGILFAGVAMLAAAAAFWGIRAAGGVLAGTALCWLNFRWLRRGAGAVIRLGLAQAGAASVHVPRGTHAKFFGRILLLIFAVYAILAWLHLPPVAVLSGLGAIVPAILLELAYELLRGEARWSEP